MPTETVHLSAETQQLSSVVMETKRKLLVNHAKLSAQFNSASQVLIQMQLKIILL